MKVLYLHESVLASFAIASYLRESQLS